MGETGLKTENIEQAELTKVQKELRWNLLPGANLFYFIWLVTSQYFAGYVTEFLVAAGSGKDLDVKIKTTTPNPDGPFAALTPATLLQKSLQKAPKWGAQL